MNPHRRTIDDYRYALFADLLATADIQPPYVLSVDRNVRRLSLSFTKWRQSRKPENIAVY